MPNKYVFRCKKCGSTLFTTDHIIKHGKLNERNEEFNLKDENNLCTSYFISNTSWMEDYTEQNGRITCPNRSCDSKLGYYCWFGGKCSCGFWQTPSFQIHKSKVDYLPDSLRRNTIDIAIIE
ncbi:Dual specificity phosphatase [Cryptosporidium tyzzeri]|nr:Dual specificity phosphatase [Cryptosporidium tyzzeri]